MLVLETGALLHYIAPNNRRHFGQDQHPLLHLDPSLLVNPRLALLCHALLLNQQPHSLSLNGAHSGTVGSDQTNHYSLASARDTDHYRRPDFSLSSRLVSSKLLGIASRSLLPGPFRWRDTMTTPSAMLPGLEAMQMQPTPPRKRAQRQTSSCLECRRRKQKVSSIFIYCCPLFIICCCNETTIACVTLTRDVRLMWFLRPIHLSLPPADHLQHSMQS